MNPICKFFAALAACSVSLVAAASSDAAVSISIDNLGVPAGTTAAVGVYASSDTADIISGFNLPTDLNRDGFSNGLLPDGFSVNPSVLQNAIYNNTGFDTPAFQIALIDVDGIATGSGSNVQLGVAPTLLFRLLIDVGPNVPVGTVLPLEIEAPADPFGALFNVAGPTNPTVAAPLVGVPVLGSITVTPEPTAAAFVVAAAGVLMRRRRAPR